MIALGDRGTGSRCGYSDRTWISIRVGNALPTCRGNCFPIRSNPHDPTWYCYAASALRLLPRGKTCHVRQYNPTEPTYRVTSVGLVGSGPCGKPTDHMGRGVDCPAIDCRLSRGA